LEPEGRFDKSGPWTEEAHLLIQSPLLQINVSVFEKKVYNQRLLIVQKRKRAEQYVRLISFLTATKESTLNV
jgi:hypothetical protein